ncbi:MAG: hypothetical protein AABZ45_00865 [Pseudomonadota bacterium]
MGEFTIGAAWSEAIAFLQRNVTTLLVLVGGSVLLAAVIQTFVFGFSQTALQAQMQGAMTSGNMDAFMTTVLPSVAGAGLIGAIIQSTGQFAALRMGLSGDEDYASSITYGLTAAVVSTLFWILVVIVVAVVLGVIFAAFGVGAMFTGGERAAATGMVGILLLIMLLILPVALWLAVRLWVISPAMADARSANPLFGLSQSWQLTGAHQWSLLGYLILIVIGALVVFGILGGIAGVIGAALGETIGSLFVALVTGVPAGILGLAINAGVYRTLAPRNAGDVFA